MPTYTYPLSADGPLVSVVVGLDGSAIASLVAAGLPIPAPLHGTGIVDTGCNVTCVAPHLLRPYQLVPGSGGTSTTVGGQAAVRLFRISLSILPPSQVTGPFITEPAMLAMELPQPIPNIDVLIGRDFLENCEFHYAGPKQRFHILF